MGIIESATTAVSSVGTAITTVTSATGLSKVADAVSGAFGAVNKFFKKLNGVQLPLPNPLHAYASYDYVVSLGVLSKQQVDNPDSTYMAGVSFPLICKSANGDPFNRIQTPYGKFDFFIEDLELAQQVGFVSNEVTTVTGVSFKVVEPYSMGMFPISLQVGAEQQKNANYRDAPFLLKLEFRGNTETGQIVSIPNTTRYIPIVIMDMTMAVDERGSIYSITAQPWNQIAMTDPFKNMTSDASIKGTTVQEVLQTGEKSLQAVVNQKFKDIAKENKIPTPDEVVIIFPEDISSASTANAVSANKEDTTTATTASSTTVESGDAIFKKLGVARSSINKTLVQSESVCNALGKSSLGFGDARRGDTPMGKENAIWDPNTKLNIRANNSINSAESEFKFSQNSDIPNAINQVLLNSDFVKETLNASNLSAEGYRGWWKIDVQTYTLGGDENLSTTGTSAKLLVYRVIPYNVHASSGPMPANTPAPGLPILKTQAVKHYNYIYTGKNVDVMKFNITVNYSFAMTLGTANDLSQDIKTAAQDADAPDPILSGNPISEGKPPSPNAIPTITSFKVTNTRSDKKGGGGRETPGVRAAKLFMDAVTSGQEMIDIELEIIGDPYYIIQSGIGNYTAEKTQFSNLNSDGTADYQSGEVHIMINFRTPVDINQSTGLYQFTANDLSAPVMQFSGLYHVLEVFSHFKKGQFTQTIKAQRLPLQEDPFAGMSDKTFNITSNAEVDKQDQYGYGEF